MEKTFYSSKNSWYQIQVESDFMDQKTFPVPLSDEKQLGIVEK